MLTEELLDLIEQIRNSKCERQNIELKAAHSGCPQRLYDTLSSFSNQDGGGIIIFGIDENRDFELCGIYDVQDLQVKVNQQCLQMEPVVRPLFTVAEIDGKSIASCEIQECDVFDKPCFYKGAGRLKGSYVRCGEADMPMTEYEIYSYEIFKRNIHDELRTDERIKVSDLDKNKINVYLSKLRMQKTNLFNLDDNQILNMLGIHNDNAPTVCGTLLFGLYPQAFFPSLCITAVTIPGMSMGDEGVNGERFIDNKKIEGDLAFMLSEAINFVVRNMKTSTTIDSNGKRHDKTEYPIKAIREIILNALIHRDYSIHTENSPIRIMMFKDRIEIENPGGLYGRLTIDKLGKVGADTRNPYLASASEIMLETENRFSGIPTIRREMKEHGLSEPLFENFRGVFKVTLFNTAIDNENMTMEERIIAFCSTPKSREEISTYFKYSNPSYMIKKYVLPLVESGKLCMTIPESPKSKLQKYYANQ